MKRSLLLVVALGSMVAVAALALQTYPPLLVLSWARKAKETPAPSSILIEMGLQDDNTRDWSGMAVVQGAKVAGREGFRFRKGDTLADPNGWTAQSHRAIRGAVGQPAVAKIEPIASVGVVLHLADVKDGGSLTIDLKNQKVEQATVPLKEVLAGKTVKLWNGAAAVRLVTTATAVASGPTEDDYPAAAYGPDGTLWVAWVGYSLREDQRRIEAPTLKGQPENFKAFYTPDFGDQLFLRSSKDGKWSEPLAVAGPREDLVRCAVAVTPKGEVCVIYSAQRQGNHDLYARVLPAGARDFGPEERVTSNPGPDINPVACTSIRGDLWLACQSWSPEGQGRIAVQRRIGGKWQEVAMLAGNKGENAWHPAIAADNTGQVAVAYDLYRDGTYDVELALFEEDAPARPRKQTVAGTAQFEARPAVAFDNQGRLWVAYEEGPEKWGQDYGALDAGDGNPLYNERSVRVRCVLPQGGLQKPTAELPTSKFTPPRIPFEAGKTNQYERVSRYAYPKIGIDLAGNVWLAYRRNFGSRYTTHPGPYWLTFVRRLDGDRWSEEIEVSHSDGLLDHRPVLLPSPNGGLLVVANTDGRYTTPDVIDNQIYTSVLSLPGAPAAAKLVAQDAGTHPPNRDFAADKAAVERMRNYTVDAGGRKYFLRRGEYHRHTEISWDGEADGSLEDMFRYAIDAADMDWIGNGDHDNGAGREYPWWLVQKFTDAFHVPGRFMPMFTYERSVSYPHGHRNCMFAQRGVRTLPRLAAPEGVKKAEGGVHPDDTKMLYRYLHELGGICAVHTSATSMGTDWRDNDSIVEPIVEIYQGDRMSYEIEDAPRAGYDPALKKEPANIAGWFPKGFVNLALQKGYRLGFQSSSDHWSTHISFFIILTEKNDRQGLLDAVRKRHCYGATDNMVVDWRLGDAIQGDEVKLSGAPTFTINVLGTTDLAKIDVLRDSEVVATLAPQGTSYRSTWTDPRPQDGTHYYYIRILQKDREIAWASPIWVERGNK